jgi:hypothetical protein
MLAYVLNRHPLVKVTPETHYFLSVAPRVFPARWAGNHDEMLDRLQRGPLLGMLDLTRAELSEPFRSRPPTWRNLLDVILNSYRTRHHAELVCEKTPDHYRFVDRIVSWFPDARIVWVVRDGRDVALSFQRAQFTHDWIWVHCQRWIHAARALRAARRRHRARLHVVRYEDFLARPDDETRRLCAFLNIDFDPRQLEAGPADDLVTPSERSHKAGANEKPDPGKAGKWMRIPSAEAAALTWVMREELVQLGYDTSSVARPSLPRALYFRLKKAVSLIGFFVYYDLLRHAVKGAWRVRLRRWATRGGVARLGFRSESAPHA